MPDNCADSLYLFEKVVTEACRKFLMMFCFSISKSYYQVNWMVMYISKWFFAVSLTKFVSLKRIQIFFFFFFLGRRGLGGEIKSWNLMLFILYTAKRNPDCDSHFIVSMMVNVRNSVFFFSFLDVQNSYPLVSMTMNSENFHLAHLCCSLSVLEFI